MADAHADAGGPPTEPNRARRGEAVATDYRIAHLIRKRMVVDRETLVRVTRLSAAGVKGIVQRLKEAGLIAERRHLLRLNPDAGQLVGVELRPDGVRVALSELDFGLAAPVA